MKSNNFSTMRFVLALLTLLALVGRPYLPPISLVIYPDAGTHSAIYGPMDVESGKVARWTDEANNEWICDFKPAYGVMTCGTLLSWNQANSHGCEPGSDYPQCSSPELDQGAGWGWENDQRCWVDQSARTTESEVGAWPRHLYCESAESDPDGDGWGWEYGQNCVVAIVSRTGQVGAQASSSHTAEANTLKRQKRGKMPEPKNSCLSVDTPVGGKKNGPRTIDLSRYEGIKVNIHYEGRANFLRLYLRNHNPRDVNHLDFTSSKYMSAYVRTEDLKAGSAYISLAEFSVEEWWIMMSNAPRELALPEFNRIVAIGVEHADRGRHKMQLQRVELVGQRITFDHLLILIACIWGAFVLLEAAVGFYWARGRQQKTALLDEAQALVTRDSLPGVLTDSVTGAFNRAGVVQQLKHIYRLDVPSPGFGILIIGIDPITDAGTTADLGDLNLKTVGRVVRANIRDGDIFGRWGESEFILLVPNPNRASLLKFAEKLRALIALQDFQPSAASDLCVTVSIGVTRARADDTMSTVVKRASDALNTAQTRRNHVSYKE